MATNKTPAKAVKAAPKAAGTKTSKPANKSANTEQTRLISLGQLRLSANNVRKVPHSDETVATIAASIEIVGLLNPLLVTLDGDLANVEAGGGRLRALHLLRAKGSCNDETPVLCRVVPADQALDISLIENTHREDMHPADQYEAFKKLLDGGRNIDDIAQAFNVNRLTVERRIALGNLHPEFMAMFRAGEISQDQCIALARIRGGDEQMAVWNSLPEYSRSAYHIKNAIFGESLKGNDPAVQFIGLDAYEEAGGQTERDLFADSDAAVRVLDKPLVARLAQDKLRTVAEAIKEAEGWAWVRSGLNLQTYDCTRWCLRTTSSAPR